MKYKKLIIILSSIFGCIALFTILSFTLFRVNSIELNFRNQTEIYASGESKTAVINSGKINRASVFGLNKDEIIYNLETSNPYLKVINLEIVFPNKLVIHVAEREELFAIKTSAEDKMYYICDSELKLLTKKPESDLFLKQDDVIILNNVDLKSSFIQMGEFLELVDGQNEVTNILYAFNSNNKNVSDLKSMFKSIDLSYETNYFTIKTAPVLTFTTYDNLKVKIGGANSLLEYKIMFMLNLVPMYPEYYSTHRLLIDINPEDVKDELVKWEIIENN